MKHLLLRLGAFGLLSVLAAVALGIDYDGLARELEGLKDPGIAMRVLERHDLSEDDGLARAVASLKRSKTDWALDHIRDLVDLRVIQSHVEIDDSAVAKAKDIKRSRAYRDPGVKESANWLGNALQRLRNIDWPSWQRDSSDDVGDLRGFGNWLVGFMWALLGIGLGVLLFFVVRHIRWKSNLARKAKALLDEDEPERSADEWLEMADKLNREGRHREAVRCLYLACLLKFDEHLVARFDRGQTNWEHLGRIQSSPKRPQSVNFLPPTQAFDLIWYGGHVQGEQDVVQFRVWYREITTALQGAKA